MNETLNLEAKASGIWSRSGVDISSARKGSEIAEMCGMDGGWLTKCPIYFRNGRQELFPIPGCYAVVERDKTPHGIVKARYNPVEASRIFRIFDKMMGREITPYRAGTVRTGVLQSYIWMMVVNTTKWPVPDSRSMFLVLSAHSGDKAIKIIPIIVMENEHPTLIPCFRPPISIKHSAAADASLSDVERNLSLAFEAHNEAAEVWAITQSRRCEGLYGSTSPGISDCWGEYTEACFNLDIKAMSRGSLGNSEAASRFFGRMLTSLMARKRKMADLLVRSARRPAEPVQESLQTAANPTEEAPSGEPIG